MKRKTKLLQKLAFTLTLMVLAINVWAQSLPFTIANKSEFSDEEIYIGLVGRINDAGVWFDCATQTVKPMLSSDNTVPGPTNGGNPGPGGNSLYANCFTKLSQIPNKTLNLPQIASVRIFIAFKSQLYLYFFGDNGGYSAPDLNNPTDPNQGIRYEIIELTYNNIGLWVNTTRVDNYQYPMGLEAWGSNIPYQKVGEIKTHQEILNLWQSRVPASFQGCYDASLGIIHAPSKTAPFKEGGAMYNYFDNYVNAVWERYRNEDLTISIGDAGVWKGRVSGDVFSFTRSTDGALGVIEAKPNTQEILEGKGVLAHDVPSTPGANDLDVQKHFCAAFNRGAINPNAPSGATQNWGNEADYFVNNTYNEYVKFWHSRDISFDGWTYAFCYDDVFEKSSTIMATNPTKAIISIGGFAGDDTPVLTTITVSPGVATVPLNSTQQYMATGYDQYGAVMAITPTWTCSAGTITSQGLFTGSVSGVQTITARVGAISATAAAQVVVGPLNIALGKPVTVSSTENTGTPGTAAVDGNINTRWASAFSDPQTITIDLQSTYQLNRVVLNWETAAAKSFQIQVSADGNNWTTMYSTTTGTGGNQSYAVSGTGRYVRMHGTVRTTGYGYSLWEFEVYGSPVSTPYLARININPKNPVVCAGSTVQFSVNGFDQFGNPFPVPDNPVIQIYPPANGTGYAYTFPNPGSYTITICSQSVCATTVVSVENCDPQCTLISRGKPASASSVEGAYTASLVNDGNNSTRWGSTFADNQWVQIDLGDVYSICKTVQNWEAAYAKSYEIRLSNDASFANYSVIGSKTNSAGGVEEIVTDASKTGRYIRMHGISRATAWGISLWEFEVYGTLSTNIPVTGISVNPINVLLSIGSTSQLTATVAPANATNKNVSWSTSNTSVATVNATGLVTAVALGNATITATSQDGGFKAISSFTVSNRLNLALNKPVTVSSVENAGTPASAAVDGNSDTRWSSAFSDPQWITIDLGASYSLTQIIINWETAFARDYQVQLSTNNSTWTTAYSTTNSTGGKQTHNITGSARYVRIYCTARATAWGCSLWEIEIYGDSPKSAGDMPEISENNNADVLIYPNPVNTELQVLLNKPAIYSNISLYDFTGKLVLSEVIENEDNNILLNVESLNPGIYILKLSGTLEGKVFKLIKN
ncbi:MAG: discoidin domain-containing protein [Bacteroidales bacterium]|nr:discoidin domain-containing protein [Bacteroidales bacterium]